MDSGHDHLLRGNVGCWHGLFRARGGKAGRPNLRGLEGLVLGCIDADRNEERRLFRRLHNFCSSQSVHALLHSNRRFSFAQHPSKNNQFFSEMFASSSEMLIRVVLRHPTHLRPTQPPLHRHLSSRKWWNSPPRLVLTSARSTRS